jgi:cephalosporin hydroxylase
VVAIEGPPPVAADPAAPLTQYWRARLSQAIDGDRYAGVPISKLPEDLRVYEHLIWAQRPSCVIEIGAGLGGSSLWFRDRLRTLGAYGSAFVPLIVVVDIDTGPARERLEHAAPAYAEEILLIEADVRDPQLPARVAAEVGERSCLVIEDGAHVGETTRAALDGFARFVPPGGFFVVEDGVVDREELRLREDWPRGVAAAIEEWLRSPAGVEFECRTELELYGVTSHPGGFLRRRPAAS